MLSVVVVRLDDKYVVMLQENWDSSERGGELVETWHLLWRDAIVLDKGQRSLTFRNLKDARDWLYAKEARVAVTES